MNLKFRKIKGMNKKGKIIGVVGILLILGVIGFQLIRSTFATEDAGYLSNQTVDNLVFSNAKLTYEDHVSKYSVQVMNDLETTYELKTIEVIFKNSDGEEIEKLTGYIGDNIKGKEIKTLDAYVDKEITKVASIEYKINK